MQYDLLVSGSEFVGVRLQQLVHVWWWSVQPVSLKSLQRHSIGGLGLRGQVLRADAIFTSCGDTRNTHTQFGIGLFTTVRGGALGANLES